MILRLLQYFQRDDIRDKTGVLVMLVLALLFVLSRLFVPIKFDGSYIDEYWHITSGIGLIESAKYTYFYNDMGAYDRGLLMSLWVGLWVSFFGKSILIAKLAPIAIAIVNYCLLYYLATKLVDRKRFQFLLLLLYMVSPWCLFNHTYIRFYVVNELLLLLLLVSGYQLYRGMRDERWRKVLLSLLFIGLLNVVNLLTTNDPSQFMILLATGVMLAALFIYEFNTIPDVRSGLFSRVSANVLLSNKVYRTALVFLVVMAAFVVLDAASKLDFLLNGTIAFTSQAGRKYGWLFWQQNGIISILFIFAVATFWWKSEGFERIILPVSGLLFLIHMAASEDLQIIRGVLYFMPLYYLTAVLGITKLMRLLRLNGKFDAIAFVVISGVFLFVTITNVDRAFYSGPRIKQEVSYIEYSRVYDAVDSYCQGKLLVEASPSAPFVADFYGISVDYVLSATGVTGKDALYTIDADTGKYKTVWGDLPVITDIKNLEALDNDICLVVRGPSKTRFISKHSEALINNKGRAFHFHKIDLYVLDKDALSRLE